MARSLHPISPYFLPLCALLTLLHASKLDTDRCGKDTACFVNRCIDYHSEDKYLRLSEDSLADPNECLILLQIKKLNKTRHVLFLRAQQFKSSEIRVVIGKFDAIFQKDVYNTDNREKPIKYLMYYNNYTFNIDLIDIRLEFSVDLAEKRKTKEFLYVQLGSDEYAMSDSSDEEAFKQKIDQTLTCSTDGLSNIENLPYDYQVEAVDLFDTKLSCSNAYSLAILTKDNIPVRIPPTICENNKWRSENYVKLDNFEGLKGFLNTSDYWKEDDDIGELYTVPETLSIGCVKTECSQCKQSTLPVSNCPNCVQPQVLDPQDFECAILICPADYEFTRDGKTVIHIEPECMGFWNDGNNLIDKLSCLPTRIQTAAVEHTETSTAHPKRNLTGKRRISSRTMDAEPKTGAGEWLKRNWVSSILVPALIVGVVGGCVIFLVFMLRTKDEQDQLIRDERRIEDELEEYDAVSHDRTPHRKTSRSPSGEALV